MSDREKALAEDKAQSWASARRDTPTKEARDRWQGLQGLLQLPVHKGSPRLLWGVCAFQK